MTLEWLEEIERGKSYKTKDGYHWVVSPEWEYAVCLETGTALHRVETEDGNYIEFISIHNPQIDHGSGAIKLTAYMSKEEAQRKMMEMLLFTTDEGESGCSEELEAKKANKQELFAWIEEIVDRVAIYKFGNDVRRLARAVLKLHDELSSLVDEVELDRMYGRNRANTALARKLLDDVRLGNV